MQQLKQTIMKTIEIKLYQFNELSEKAQERALEDFRYINVDNDWWFDYIMEDVKELCLSIEEFDIYRRDCEVAFLYNADETIKAIKENAGGELLLIANEYEQQVKELFKAYSDYEKYQEWLRERDYTLDDLEFEDWVLEETEYEEDKENIYIEFLKELGEYYLSELQSSYDYHMSNESVIGTIEANEYEFTENGKRY